MPVTKRIALALALVLLATGVYAQPVPDPLWDGRLWLTAQAFGLEEDCPVRVLFQDPSLRSTPVAGGGEVASRLVSQSVRGGDLFLTIDTTRAGTLVERVVLQLRGHPAERVVSVESIRMGGTQDGGSRTLSYSDAVNDDDEYDVYTDTLVSLYKTFFEAQAVRARLSLSGR